MDLANLVRYEEAVPLQLRHPVTGKPIGATFYVRHIDCDAALAVVDRHEGERRLESITDRAVKSSMDRTAEMAAACISGWEWGDASFDGAQPEWSPEAALAVLRKAKWIAPQVVGIATKIANFTETSKRG
jgi:hypothetical protein